MQKQDQKPLDVLCLGRVAIDLYSEQIHAPLREAQTFRKYVGGCAGNMAIGCARLGLKSGLLSKVGADEMGAYIRKTLLEEGVDAQYVFETPDHLTGLVLLGIQPPDHFPLMFYRENCADMQLKPDEIAQSTLHQTQSLVLTGTGFSTANMRAVSHRAIQLAKEAHCTIVLDLDFRPVLWNLAARGNGETRYVASKDVTHHYQQFLPLCDILVGTEEEFLIAAGTLTLKEAVAKVQSMTKALLVVKQGADGCTVYPEMEPCFQVPGYPVDVLNVLGAGDAFLSGFLSGFLRNESLKMAAQRGNAAGALVVTRHGCSPAMPYREELQQFMNDREK